jgi:putative addiction module killer protein
MEVKEQHLLIYETDDGKSPFEEWIDKLRDSQARRRIFARLGRVRAGNFGDSSPVGEGVLELRFHFGPGYRVYFGRDGGRIVVLLAGGDKSTQATDIEEAKKHWRSYLEKKNANS